MRELINNLLLEYIHETGQENEASKAIKVIERVFADDKHLKRMFEKQMRMNGLFDSGCNAMTPDPETGGYLNQDTNAMWCGFLLCHRAIRGNE